MKRIFKYFTIASLSGMLCLFLAIPANAQRGGHGGGGGGFHGGGGGGGSFHGNTGGGFSGGRSASVAPQRSYSAPQRSYSAPQRSYNAAPQRSFQQNNRASINNNARTYSANPGARGYVSGSAGVNTRIGVGGRAYAGGRTYAGVSGRGYGAFAARGGYYYNRGFYRSSYYPRIGFSLGYLPYGYYPFYWGDYQYYYSGGYFYNYDNGQYTVVEPPVGAAINTLPSGAQPITINGEQYYELNGVYYLPITKDDGSVAYQVAGKDGQLDTSDSYGQVQNNSNPNMDTAPEGTHAVARIGDMINQLPQGSRKVTVNGQSLYVTPDDVYLKQTADKNGNSVYSVVGTPDQE